jgi:RND family efflux transporter MFP subunit
MEFQRKHVLITAAAAVAVVLISMRLVTNNARASQPETPAERVAAVALVERKPIVESITLSGDFRPYQEVDLHAKVAGYIRKMYVDVGDHVKSGQVLAELEVPELNAQVKGAAAAIQRSTDAIQRAQSEVTRAVSSYKANHTAYTRLKQASEQRPGLIAEQELDDALAKDQETEAQVSVVRSALAEADSQLNIAEAERNRLAALEAYSHITAPFSGVITKRYADVGSLIQAGTASNTQAMPVVQLAEWTRLRLVVPVPESAVPQLHLKSTVDVRVPALHRTFQGVVARYADALSDDTRTMHTEIDVQNTDGSLVEGMYAETGVVLNRKNDALSIPIEAIQRNGEGANVLVVGVQGEIEQRDIKVGLENSDRVEVVSGLHERDRVVVGNRSAFRPGDIVEPKVVETGAVKPEAAL